MSEINIVYFLFVLFAAIIQICIFSMLFDKQKYKNIKGSFREKIKPTFCVVLVFLIPMLYTFPFTFNLSIWFDITKWAIFLGILIELFMSNNENKLFSYKSFLMIFSFYTIIIIPVNIKETFILAILIISMDTLMSFYGKFIVSKIPFEFIKLRYPKSVSKNKTGLSVILSYITMITVYSYLFDFWLISIVSFGVFFGDAVLSHYKRKNNVSDFSNLLGVIGGFTDRFDSWKFTFYFVSISGLVVTVI
jgi:CDP-diglyceride synthetase